MNPEFDIIIVGSGPAGVSAALPLVLSGLKVLMVDGGKEATTLPPSQFFLSERFQSTEQWKWMLGKDFHALKNLDAVSPKLRTPTFAHVFSDFSSINRIEAENFVAVGSLSKGGLSSAWGCGVARFSASELAAFPFPASEIEHSYEAVTRRIGVSGAQVDDLSEYFGVDAWASTPIQMDRLHHYIYERYNSVKPSLNAGDFRMGRSRVAALSNDTDGRKACNLSANCLWGCQRRALYSASDELPTLMKYDNFHYRSGLIVDKVVSGCEEASIQGQINQTGVTVKAKKILLAAGTLSTTRLVLHALNIRNPVHLQSSPTAAFLLWLPRMLGLSRENGFGLGQLSFTLKLSEEISAFGSTFSTTAIPVSEFIRHLPFRRRYAIDLLRSLLSSCLVGNLFLPGSLSTTSAALNARDELKIKGGYSDALPDLMKNAAAQLRKYYWRMGALLLPLSFTVGRPGSDIHYSSTLPMRAKPTLGETNMDGEVAGLPGIHIVDGACLPTLPEKSHTLTIMANADRIGRALTKMHTN